MTDGFASNPFDERKHDMAAVEHGYWQHVQQRKIHVHEHAKPKSQPPTLLAAEQARIDVHDCNGATEMLRFDVRMTREQRAESVEHCVHTGSHLLNGPRMTKA